MVRHEEDTMSDRRTASTINDIQLDELYEQMEQLRAAVVRVRSLAGRIRQGVPWTASDDDIADHILRALDEDQTPAPSCSPDAAETEPNNPATWTPPPPGDRREQLPDDAESFIVCTTACDEQHTYDWTCALFAGSDDDGPADLVGYLAPDPPIGCLTAETGLREQMHPDVRTTTTKEN